MLYNELEFIILKTRYKRFINDGILHSDLDLASAYCETLQKERRKDTTYECTDFLVRIGLNVDTKDEGNNTALLVAARYGDYKMVRHLLEQGADLTVRNNWGESAFEMAISYQRCNNLVSFKQKCDWLGVYTKHKDQLDNKDLVLYHSYRLSILLDGLENN
jgi:hypothetical protein